jgi:hypothetical protein
MPNVICVMRLCGLVGGYQHFRGKHYFHLQDEVSQDGYMGREWPKKGKEKE